MIPFCVRWQVAVRVCVPPPHEVLQELQSEYTKTVGHAAVLHEAVVVGFEDAVQKESATAALVDEEMHCTAAVCTPVPQSTLHADHAPCCQL